jgi:hypothetical protein
VARGSSYGWQIVFTRVAFAFSPGGAAGRAERLNRFAVPMRP